MGNGISERATCQQRDREISKNLAKEGKEQQRTMKLLLLGPGGSGKSTVLKQMRVIHNNQFTAEELKMIKVLVYSNVLKSMETIVRAMHTSLNMAFKNTEREEDSMVVFEAVKFGQDGEPLTERLALAIRRLWDDVNVKKAFEMRSQYQVTDSAQYFLDSIDRIASVDYHPNADDILHARAKTTGIIEVRFKIQDFTLRYFDLRVIDMGGQRSERRKWIQCFEDVHSILFIAAVSEYDQMLEEDETANRMVEALQLFKWICHMDCFKQTSIILFLNKIDIFRQKLNNSHITVAFPKYKGLQNYDECMEYIKEEFNRYGGEQREIYVHETCATDTKQVQTIIKNTVDITIRNNMHMIGLV